MPLGIPAGQAVFSLRMNDRLTSGLQKAAATARNITARMAKAALVAGTAGLTVGAAGLKRFADAGDKIDKMAVRTRIGREALQELAHAANLTGTDINQLGSAMFRASRRIGNATMGTGPAVRALKELRLNAKELSQKSPAEQFEAIVAALNEIGDVNQRNQFGFEIFGDNFRQIQPLVDAGADSIRSMRGEARRLGIVLSEEEVRKAAALTDSMARVGSQVDAMFQKIGAGLADYAIPALERLSIEMSKLLFKLDVAFYGLRQSLEGPLGLFGIKLYGGGGIPNAPIFPTGDTGAGFGGVSSPSFLDVQGSNSAFINALASRASGNLRDPKTEEKQMVGLLEDIRDAGPLLMGQ